MKKSLIDVPVLLIFFCRPHTTEKVFEQIKIARPSKLFLYQDGARAHRPDDVDKVMACRKIVEAVDWACEVHQFYQEKNVGVDPSEYIAQKWAFSFVDRCIVLEDDDLASQSFFPFCAELLERYKDDQRINMICGMNHLGEYHETPNSYFFSNTGAITGWASWKRVVDTWEEHYDVLDDAYASKLLEVAYEDIGLSNHLPAMRKNKASGIAHYETILGLARFSQSRLCIIPAKNLIQNIGLGVDAAHTSYSVAHLPAAMQGIFGLKNMELQFPLKHPTYVINDVIYSDRAIKALGGRLTFSDRVCRKLQRLYYRLKSSF